MKFINAQQLAFVLDINKEDARAKMCVAWSRANGLSNSAHRKPGSKKIIDDYPLAMEIEMLAKQLNLPTLQSSVDDITENYLTRPASKKWILCDFPEKAIKKAAEDGKVAKLNIPPALKSMLSNRDVEFIKREWAKRYCNVIV